MTTDVYVASEIPDSIQLRAAAAAVQMPRGAIACGRTAAWIHGIETTALGPTQYIPAQWCRAAADVVEVAGVAVTSPIATTVELAMQLPRPFALSAVDAMLRSGRADRWAVRAASTAYRRPSRNPPGPPDPPVRRPPRRVPQRILASPPPYRRRPSAAPTSKSASKVRPATTESISPTPTILPTTVACSVSSTTATAGTRVLGRRRATKYGVLSWLSLVGTSSPSAAQTSGAATPRWN